MAPFLHDDVVREILRHLQPWCLVRASLVCKHWRGLVTDPCFLRRLRAPVIGVFHNNCLADAGFIPTVDPPDSRFLSPPAYPWYVHDCRRGLVLLRDYSRILVWDPATNDRLALPQPPVCDAYYSFFGTALIRPRDDDVASRRRSFCVAIALIRDGVARGAVYSSDTGMWASHVTAQAPASYILSIQKPGTVVGEAAHWLLNGYRVLKLHAGGGQQAVMAVLEPRNVPDFNEDNVQLMRTHDGVLGLAAVRGFALRQWTLKTEENHGGAMSWMLCRTIRFDESLLGPMRGRRYPGRFLDEKLSLASVLALLDSREAPPWARIAGVDEDGAVVFLRRMGHLIMLRLEPTPRIRKICEGFFVLNGEDFATVYPYACFFLGGNIVT